MNIISIKNVLDDDNDDDDGDEGLEHLPFSVVALSFMSSKQRLVSSKIACRRLE